MPLRVFSCPRQTRRSNPWAASALAVALIAAAACSEDAASPTGPAPAPEVTEATTAPLSFTQVSSGGWHTCAIATDQRAYCWGLNTDGQLGIGSTVNRSRPTLVARGLRFFQISASDLHTCGQTTDNLVYCWGNNEFGQLGINSHTRRVRPVPVKGGRSFVHVNTGAFYSCALTSTYLAFCWGSNSQGQLGDGTTTDRLIPVAVGGGHQFHRLVAGGAHTCAVNLESAGYCWGDNGFFKLGDGSSVAMRVLPSPIAGGISFQQVTAGNGHTCGVATDNTAYCWGLNDDGQLGDGTLTRRQTPQPVAGGVGFRQTVAAATHTCGVSSASSVAQCWGDNFAGRLGDGTETDRTVPTALATSVTFSGVSPGTSHGCGVTTQNRIYCWGHNAFGQLGLGTTAGPQTCQGGIKCSTRPREVVAPS